MTPGMWIGPKEGEAARELSGCVRRLGSVLCRSQGVEALPEAENWKE